MSALVANLSVLQPHLGRFDSPPTHTPMPPCASQQVRLAFRTLGQDVEFTASKMSCSRGKK
jgi:hypothetical protein